MTNAKVARARRTAQGGKAPSRRTAPSETTAPSEEVAATQSSEENTPEGAVQHPGIVILRVPGTDGDEDLQVMAINGMDPLAVPTVLKLALDLQNNKLGIKERS